VPKSRERSSGVHIWARGITPSCTSLSPRADNLCSSCPAVNHSQRPLATFTLRNGGLLIDLKDLNKVISIDVAAPKAIVQQIISNHEIQRALNAKGLAYPSGHCPQVKLSG
jgi:FAD binding domain